MAERDEPDSGASNETSDSAGVSWGRVLDTAGIVAGVLLVAMIADILTDGRLISRRLTGRPAPPPPDTQESSDGSQQQ